MVGVLSVGHEHGLHEVVQLLAALAEGVHFSRQEIEQRVVAVPAVEVKHSVVLVMIVLAIARPENVHAKGELVLAAQNVHVVGGLKAADREASKGAGSASDC